MSVIRRTWARRSRHHLAVGLEAGLIGLLQETDRLVQGGVAVVQFLRLAGELRDALQEELRVPVDCPVDAAFGAVSHGLITSFLVAASSPDPLAAAAFTTDTFPET